MTTILLIGGADTGRAPMAAALLRRLQEARGYAWSVGSAGVLGHDGALAEQEARDAMAHLGLDLHTHEARSLTEDLAAQAALLIAIDHGTALVLRSRFASAQARIHTLGELAGQPRDIPDPFRMQLGAWLTYARELEAMLIAALPRLSALVGAPPQSASDTPRPPISGERSGVRSEAVARMARLLRVVEDMPGVVDWAAVRSQLETDLNQAAAEPRGAGDLVAVYSGLLRAALAITTAPPSAGQIAALREAVARLDDPVRQDDLNAFSTRLAGWMAR
jgi:protein-tyrosine phosphatase